MRKFYENPNDLDLKFQIRTATGKMGTSQQTISTLERLNMLYPDNVEIIKLYLLSVHAGLPETL